MSEPTHRERLLKVIDETPEEMKKDFLEWMDEIPKDEVQNIVKGHPFFSQLSMAAIKPMVDEMMQMFWEEIEGDLTAFCDFWKNQIPSDIKLDAMTEGDIIGLEDAFEADTERIFMVFLDRFQAKLNHQDPSAKSAIVLVEIKGQSAPIVIGPFGSLEEATEWRDSELHGVNNTIVETVDSSEAVLLIQEKGLDSLKGEVENTGYSFQFASKEDAELVVETVIGLFESYEYVTVSDVRELIGLSTDYTQHRIGWRRLEEMDGRWVINRLKDLKVEEMDGRWVINRLKDLKVEEMDRRWVINFPEPKKLY